MFPSLSLPCRFPHFLRFDLPPPCRYERLPEPPSTDDPLWGDFDAESSDRLYMIGINGRGQVEGGGVETNDFFHFDVAGIRRMTLYC